MSDYVTKITLAINGEEITDFKSVTEKEYELRKQVKLMNKTGFINVTPQFGVDVEYVVPENAPEYDFSSVEGGTLILTFGNGEITTYTGVCTLKIGATKYDGDNEATRTIELAATGRE